MAKETFRGGIHPNEHKEYSRGVALKVYETKGDVILPLSQNIGRPAKPVVKRNDPVRVGQVIGEADGFVSANIIASVSGKVKAIEKRRTLNGSLQECIVIENDGAHTIRQHPFDNGRRTWGTTGVQKHVSVPRKRTSRRRSF